MMTVARERLRPFVSVVMPCYNSQGTIGDALASIEAQEYPRDRFEVIVADNGSTDGVQDWISKKYPHVRLISVPSKGSGNARNAGFAAAVGKWILSIDSDCVADPQWISMLVSAMEKAPEGTAALGGCIEPYRLVTLCERYQPAWVSQPDLTDGSRKIRYVATPNAIFVRAAVEQVGCFDADAGHDDTDLGIRLTAAGYRCALVPEAIIRHRNPVSLSELYEHRLKYGERNFILAQRHVEIFGNPAGIRNRRHLFWETIGRIARDAIKLPLSIVYRPKNAPIWWPLADAVMAWGNYRGFILASKRED